MPKLPVAYFTAADNALSEAMALEFNRHQISSFSLTQTYGQSSIIQSSKASGLSLTSVRYLIIDNAFVRNTFETGGIDRALNRYQNLLTHLKPGLMPLLLIPDHYFDQTLATHPFHRSLVDLVSGCQKLSQSHHFPLLPIFIRDLFSPKFPWLPTPLNHILGSIKTRSLTLEGPPELPLSPITLTEIAPLLLRPSFSPPHHPKALRFTGSHHLTYLNVALALRNHLESAHHLTLDLSLTNSHLKVISSPGGLETIAPDHQPSFSSVLSHYDRDLFPGFHKHRAKPKTQKASKPTKVASIKPPIPVKKVKTKSKARVRFRPSPLFLLPALLIVLMILITPWFALRFSSTGSPALSRFYSLSNNLASAQVSALNSLAHRLNLTQAADFSNRLNATILINQANHLKSRSLDWADQVLIYSLTGQNPPASSQSLLSEFDLHFQSLAHLQATTYQASIKGEQGSQALEDLRQSIQMRRVFIRFLGRLFYSSSASNLALLLQNQNELRPSGGFLESVALLSLDQGRLVNQQFKSIGELEQAISGQIKPPADLAAHLSTDRWYFRDLNWSPQFSETAKTLNWFLERAGLPLADSVIGTTSSFWIELLTLTGPLSLESGQSIDSVGLANALQANSSEQGTAQNLQAEVFKSFLKHYSSFDPRQRHAFLLKLEAALHEGEVIIDSADPAFSRFLNHSQFTGNLPGSSCQPLQENQTCLNGSLALNEANLGANRANASLVRTLEHSINLSGTGSQNHLKLSLENQSQTDVWPMGDYQTYLRLYLPLDLENLEVILNNVTLSAQDLSVSRRYSLIEVGLNLTVPVSSAALLEIKYHQPLPNPFASLTYQYRLKRQPGTLINAYRLNLTVDPQLKPYYLNSPISFDSSRAVFTGSLSQDFNLTIELLQSK